MGKDRLVKMTPNEGFVRYQSSLSHIVNSSLMNHSTQPVFSVTPLRVDLRKLVKLFRLIVKLVMFNRITFADLSCAVIYFNTLSWVLMYTCALLMTNEWQVTGFVRDMV